MRKRSKLQKKIQMSTNHQTKENVLNQIKEIENNLKISINTERNLRETRVYCCYQEKPKILLQISKKQLNDQSWNWTSPGWRGNLEPSNKNMSELLNEQYNIVFSTPDPTMTIKYPNDIFGHLQGNTLSDINITREDLIDAIKPLTKLFWRPWWISSNTSQTMQQEPSPPSPTAV